MKIKHHDQKFILEKSFHHETLFIIRNYLLDFNIKTVKWGEEVSSLDKDNTLRETNEQHYSMTSRQNSILFMFVVDILSTQKYCYEHVTKS